MMAEEQAKIQVWSSEGLKKGGCCNEGDWDERSRDPDDGTLNVLDYSTEPAKEYLPLPFRTGMGVIGSQVVIESW